MTTIDAMFMAKDQALQLGKQGENGVTVIDFSSFLADCATEYGEGTLALAHQRSEDSAPYAVSLTGGKWTVSNSDVQYVGLGICELTYTVGTTIKKSRHWKTNVLSALGATVTPPAAWQSYIDSVMAAVASIEDMTVSATTLSAGSSATVTKSTANGVTHLTFGLPRGQNGKDGKDGKDAEITHNNIVSALGYTPANATALTGKQDVIDDLDTIRSKANSALQSETDPTVPSWAKQQSKPTYQANEIVMGDSTVGAEISELSEDIVGKLSEPSSGLAVGKYFRIASIDDSGHAVLEECDAPATDVQINGTSITSEGVANIPIANGASHGVLKLSSDYNLTITSAGVLRSTTCTTDQYQGRDNYSVISKGTLENIKTDLVGIALADTSATAYTAEQQAAARSRIGLDKEWVLKCTISTESKADIFSVDMAGYTELYIYSTAVATGNGNLYIQGNRPLTQQLYANGTRVSVAYFKDDMLGIAPIYGRLGSAATNLASTLTAAHLLNISVSQITMLKLSHPDLVTSCDIKIYAR